ncbi:MFS transporter [Halopolyspora algeriensis]|uniref:Multidrug efflux pump Tap n=1 Tax=Halopolyspora algeriensis TaxID=1500506 RepID=A0A368VN78_9ACTN|nr:MFS transporter [Halopolyspora algeriensis]RCW40492.1 MFS transporter [Halopolyspora algeriensis]TQM53775.1 MFS transporter [Halopolyspora algeriensis]
MSGRRRTPLVLLWVSHGCAATASTATFVAIPWFVLMTTGSATRVGVVTAAELVGLVAVSLVTGPLVDRVGARRTVLVSDVAGAASVVSIPMLHITAGLAFWQLIALSAVLGASREPGHTARRMMVPELIAHSGVPMERGAGGMDAAKRAGEMLGAPLAGVALALVDAPGVLVGNAGLFLLAAGLTLLGVPRTAVRSPESSTRTSQYFCEIAEGLRYLRRDRLIAAILAMLLITNMLDVAAFAVLFPSYADQVLHSPVALGAIVGVFGGSALVGNIVFTWVGHRAGSRRHLFTASMVIGTTSPHVAMALESGLVTVLIVVAIAGLAASTVNPVLAVVTYERIPAELRGRVLSMTTVVAQGGTPLGVLIGGILVDGVGLLPTLWMVVASYLTALSAPLLFPVWAQMDDPGTTRPRDAAVESAA